MTPVYRAPLRRDDGLSGRIYRAGVEISSRWNGYREGGVRSGERAAREVEALAVEALRRRLGGVAGTRLDTLAADVVAGRIDPYTAAHALIEERP